MRCLMKTFCRGDQGLRGNAAPIEAGSTKGLLFNNRRLLPELSCANSSRVSAWACANDNDIKIEHDKNSLNYTSDFHSSTDSSLERIALTNCAPMEPSTMRWSAESVIAMTVRILISPFTTAGT